MSNKKNMIFEQDVNYYLTTGYGKKVSMIFKKGDIIDPDQLPKKQDFGKNVDMTDKATNTTIDGYTITRKEDPKKLEAEKKAKLELEAKKKKEANKLTQKEKDELKAKKDAEAKDKLEAEKNKTNK